MFKKILLLSFVGLILTAEGYDLFPTSQNDYVNKAGTIRFGLNRNHLLLTVMDGKRCDAWIDICGPLFPNYCSAVLKQAHFDSADESLVAEQYCPEFKAMVLHRIEPIDGGFHIRTSWRSEVFHGERPVMHRVLFRLPEFAGKEFSINKKNHIFSPQKSSAYKIASGSGACELRVNVNAETDIVFQYDATLGNYQLADCRFHPKPEDRYHFYARYVGNELDYNLFILKKGEPVPAPSAKKSPSAGPVRNLLNPGSDFEVGNCGVVPQTTYAYTEEHLPEASIQPHYSEDHPRSGKYCLELHVDNIPDCREKFSRAVFSPVRLDPGKEYTLSAWFCSNTPGMRAVLSTLEPTPGAVEDKRIFPVDSTWRRYVYTFRPEKFKVLNFRVATAGIDPEIKAGTLCVDDVQLEEGASATPYFAFPTEFSAVIEDEYAIYEQDKLSDGKVTLRFRNNSLKPETFRIGYRLLDYRDHVIRTGNIEKTVAPNSGATESLRYPELPCGYYRLLFADTDQRYRDEAIFIVYRQMNDRGLLPLNWPLGHSNGECTAYIRKLGFGSVRTWSAPFFRIMRGESQWDFSSLDAVVRRAEIAQTNVFPILGPRFDWSIPPWAIAETKAPPPGSGWNGKVNFPRLEIWRKYVNTLASRYRNRIRAWEVLNEPNCFLTPEDYIPYLHGAFEEIKSVDSGISVVGGCATSDFGLAPAAWTRKMMTLDQCRDFDAVSIHMYSDRSPETTYDQGTQWADSVIRKAGAEFGRDIPVWHTEKGYTTTSGGYSLWKTRLPPVYIHSQHERIRYRVADFREVAEFMIRQTLLDAAVGKGVFFWFGMMPNHTYKNIYQFELQHYEFDMSPSAQLAAANGLARMLEGRFAPVGLLHLGGSTLAAVFRGDAGTVAAVWNFRESSRTLTLPKADFLFELRDFFGEPVPAFDGRMLVVGTAPVYLISEKHNPELLEGLLQRAATVSARTEVRGWYELRDNKPVAVLEFVNTGIIPQPMSISVSGDMKFERNRDSFSCPPGEAVRRIFPIADSVYSARPVELALDDMEDSPRKVSLPPAVSPEQLRAIASPAGEASAAFRKTAPVIDGKLNEWGDVPVSGVFSPDHLTMGRNRWRSFADLSAEVRFGYDRDFLYFAARIYDDALIRSYPARTAYYSDSVELFLSGKAFPRIRKTGETYPGPEDFQFILAPGDSGGEFPQATVSCPQAGNREGQIRVASAPFDEGYVLEAAIPWSLLGKKDAPAPGTVLPMTFQVRDSDERSAAARTCMAWTGGLNNYASPWNWGKLTLAAPACPR